MATDARLCVIFANPAACSLCRCNLEDLLGKEIFAFFLDEDQPRLRQLYESGQRGGRLPLRLSAAGELCPVELSMGAPDDDGGRSFMLRRTLDEALELERLREECRRARESAALAERAIAVVSHDFRNLLSNLTLNTELVVQHLTPEVRSKVGKPIERILRSAHQMRRMVNDLLHVGQLNAGEWTLRLGTHDPGELIEAALELHASIAASNGTALVASTPTELPPVLADRERILQVLSYLVGNALKFTPPGGTVTVGASEAMDAGGGVWFTVSDTGTGIDELALDKIFDKFWQGGSKRGGIGLGLSIAKAIVEAHGAGLVVKSELGRGTSFTFALPRAPSY